MSRLRVIGQWIEFDGQTVAMLKPHAKPGELYEFLDYLEECLSVEEVEEDIENAVAERETDILEASKNLLCDTIQELQAKFKDLIKGEK